MLIGILVILEDNSEVSLFFEVKEENLILSSENIDDECHLTWFLENALYAIDKVYMADNETSSYEEVILRLRPYFLCRGNIKVMSMKKTNERKILLSGEDILHSFITLVYFNKEIEE